MRSTTAARRASIRVRRRARRSATQTDEPWTTTPAGAASPATLANGSPRRASIRVPVDFCPFPVVADYVIRRTLVGHLDQDGNLVRVVFNIWFDGTLTNSVTGESVRNWGHRMIVEDARTQTSSEAGGKRATAPGEGVILLDAGRLVLDWNGTPENFDDDQLVFVAGPHQADVEGDTGALCAVLAAD